MNKRIAAFFIIGAAALAVSGCQNQTEEPTASLGTEPEIAQTTEAASTEAESGEEEVFSFADLTGLEFCFSSGAGGWATTLTIRSDGSFSGEYFDGEMGDWGEAYPNGTMYQSNFSGQFTQPVKVDEYTWSMKIGQLVYEQEAGTEEIIDGIRYCYSEVYGLEDAKDILLYLPGTPLSGLTEEFRSWVGYYSLTDAAETALPFYALNNEALQYGFSSYSIVENLWSMIVSTEKKAADLKDSIKNDTFTQAEYNEKSMELYNTWDYALNEIWDALKRIKTEEEMKPITAEELAWIDQKEQAVQEAGAEFEGGSLKPLVVNQKAAQMTEDRVYELMKLFD